MVCIENSEDAEFYSVRFTTKLYVRFVEDIFHIYGVIVHERLLCKFADSANVNHLVAPLPEIQHIGCYGHWLAFEVRKMILYDANIDSTINFIYEAMRQCKSKQWNWAILHNKSYQSPMMFNEIRYSGAFLMLKRFIAIREKPNEVADFEESVERGFQNKSTSTWISNPTFY